METLQNLSFTQLVQLHWHTQDIIERLHEESYLCEMSPNEAKQYVTENEELIKEAFLKQLNPFDTIDFVELHKNK